MIPDDEIRVYCIGRGLHEEYTLGYLRLAGDSLQPVGWAATAGPPGADGRLTSLEPPLTVHEGGRTYTMACRICDETHVVDVDTLLRKSHELRDAGRRSLNLMDTGDQLR